MKITFNPLRALVFATLGLCLVAWLVLNVVLAHSPLLAFSPLAAVGLALFGLARIATK